MRAPLLSNSIIAVVIAGTLWQVPHALASPPSVVILGDSLSVTEGVGLGNRLDRSLRGQGYDVTTVASCGSSPSSYLDGRGVYRTRCGFLWRHTDGTQQYLPWDRIRGTSGASTPKLGEIFGSGTADLAVIQQGTNLYGHLLGGGTRGTQAISDQVYQLVKSADAKQVLWVGPPAIARYDGKTVSESQMKQMNAAIQDGLSRAAKDGKSVRFMDSLPVTKRPGGDGTHHGSGKETDQWVAKAEDEAKAMLEGKSEHLASTDKNASPIKDGTAPQDPMECRESEKIDQRSECRSTDSKIAEARLEEQRQQITGTAQVQNEGSQAIATALSEGSGTLKAPISEASGMASQAARQFQEYAETNSKLAQEQEENAARHKALTESLKKQIERKLKAVQDPKKKAELEKKRKQVIAEQTLAAQRSQQGAFASSTRAAQQTAQAQDLRLQASELHSQLQDMASTDDSPALVVPSGSFSFGQE